MTLAVSTVLYDGYSFDAGLADIAEAGFTLIEPAYIHGYVDFGETDLSEPAARQLRHRAQTEGLGIRAVSAHLDLGEADAAEMLRRRVRFAAELGAEFLITNSASHARMDSFRAALETAQDECEATGVVLALENPGHGADNLIGTLAEGNALLDRIGADWIGLNYDIGNVFTYSRGACDPLDDLAGDLRHVVHYHLKDVATVADDWVFTPIGQGDLPYDQIIPALMQHGDVPASLEMPLRLARPGRADPVRRQHPCSRTEIAAAFTTSRAFCRSYGLV
ncbi:sugar phosphate isomerase/epimerase [Sulfitobacter sp. M368]|uniref:sugar phosphate isomerase/epimerase family protein n=1 Tax=Sulfitobacter sp. M368 TaxID=2867021 RepID=UPI0021A6901A|nr:sugar phosphate isomerase/epimerase [Sulfitobacter sp. M368]UWR16412.1 sugar phosphate isomerase/epimerase [Sulfitobacter sp. M368]